MKAMIFAAGLGTRLRPLTDTMPKALVPVCGQPLLHHVMERLTLAGFDDFVVNVHHFPDAIISYLTEAEMLPGRKIAVSDERDFLRETGGGIRYARPLLEGDGGFLVHNVDILSDADFGWLRSAVPADALAALLVSERQTKRYLLFDPVTMRLKGWTNIETGEIRSPYPGLEPSKCRMLAYSGIQWVSGSIFGVFDKEKAGDRFPILDFYLSVCDRYPIYGLCPEKGLRLMDVGKIATLDEAGDFLTSLQ
ncbi:MAG: NTP transferase domain-containing protein [Bacteroidales bacterium]|nr:NTP transferase domain-containing protein [Bacteroidales bacterium]